MSKYLIAMIFTHAIFTIACALVAIGLSADHRRKPRLRIEMQCGYRRPLPTKEGDSDDSQLGNNLPLVTTDLYPQPMSLRHRRFPAFRM
jgi:hypothetical protein